MELAFSRVYTLNTIHFTNIAYIIIVLIILHCRKMHPSCYMCSKVRFLFTVQHIFSECVCCSVAFRGEWCKLMFSYKRNKNIKPTVCARYGVFSVLYPFFVYSKSLLTLKKITKITIFKIFF